MKAVSLKARKLQHGDTIALVSLSSGILGEPFMKRQLDLGVSRLESYGFKVKVMPHALKGSSYLSEHPEARAQDLIAAFEDTEVKAILCAIGGIEGFKLAPHLLETTRLAEAVAAQPKIFLGFSDTTVHHLMLTSCGLRTFYGQAFIPDIAEHSSELLPYTRMAFENLFLKGHVRAIRPSPVWYEERKSFGAEQFGVERVKHEDSKGYELLRGPAKFRGQIFAGCIESIYDFYQGTRYPEEPAIIKQYELMPKREFWTGKILLLESSENQPSPETLETMLRGLSEKGIFDHLEGLLVGKPQDERYYDEYKEVYVKTVPRTDLPIVFNINVGHATPRAIIPLWTETEVDVEAQKIIFLEDVLV